MSGWVCSCISDGFVTVVVSESTLRHKGLKRGSLQVHHAREEYQGPDGAERPLLCGPW